MNIKNYITFILNNSSCNSSKDLSCNNLKCKDLKCRYCNISQENFEIIQKDFDFSVLAFKTLLDNYSIKIGNIALLCIIDVLEKTIF